MCGSAGRSETRDPWYYESDYLSCVNQCAYHETWDIQSRQLRVAWCSVLVGPYTPLRQAMQPAVRTIVAQQRQDNPYTPRFQVRFRLIRFPVVKKPLSPIAPRHSIDNWPSVARPSRLRSFWRVSKPSFWPSSCSTRYATCRTSRGLSVGNAGMSELMVSQLSDFDWNGGLGLSFVCFHLLASHPVWL